MKKLSGHRGSGGRSINRVGVAVLLTGLLFGSSAFSAQAVGSEADYSRHRDAQMSETLVDLAGVADSEENVSDELAVRIPLLKEPGNPDSPEEDDDIAHEIQVSADGKFAYGRTSRLRDHGIIIFDLEKRLHIETRLSPYKGYLRFSLSAAKNANVLAYVECANCAVGAEGDRMVILLDTTTNTEIARYGLPHRADSLIEISDDGKTVFILAEDGRGTQLLKLDTQTGEITEGPKFSNLLYGSTLALNPDGLSLAVSLGVTVDFDPGILMVVNAETLEVSAGPFINEHVMYLNDLTYDSSGAFVIGVETTGLVVSASPQDGTTLRRITHGLPFNGIVPVPHQDRAWLVSENETQVFVADFETGALLPSHRELPGAGNSFTQTTNGDLVVSNGGWWEVDCSISVLLAPEVTSQPVDAEISTLGESVQFEASLNGVKADLDSGVTWQSSADGETWNDLEEHTTTLQLTADAEAVALQYRMSYTDEFWGQTGATDAVRIVGVQPVITSAPFAVKTKVGESLDPVTVTATAQPGYTWSVEGLPAGLSFDAETGVLSGTATEAGTFTVTVTVTDVFGTASQESTITVVSNEGGGDDDGDDGDNDGDDADSDDGTNGTIDDGKDPLPNTGSEAMVMVAIAAVIALGAGVAVVIARRRSLTDNADA
ncbi:putative Ig domain-containing protein [Leucobacter sp. UCMA 4100]|uniref:putative Ig domain-containing protein n=1 Tax=Leucobacter sp. UCMA 4100 TaxID=2810534 RepID=UPI0022EB165D|nr:putative Ig domain-containing protein [Leucobacter sp. UCMA 4100]MDA3146345.1 putative Ig domain-containing protein [Leucobacter sp. UCMA 4100]